MQDFDEATAVERVDDGRFRCTITDRWAIWGPMGGYVASMALRAAGAVSVFDRPASFSCHYLTPGTFDEADVVVETLRRGRTAESLRVSLVQGERRILEALVWSTADVEPLEHDVTTAPDVPAAVGLTSFDDLMPEEAAADRFSFFDHLDQRPVTWSPVWPPPGPLPPTFTQWMAFRPKATFTDPWLDACRSVVFLDLSSWPSAHQQHAWKWPERQEWMAPTLDLYVAFHEPCPDDPWLLVDAQSPIGRHGLLGWDGRAWSSDGRLVASAAGQMLARRLPPSPG